MGRRLTGTFPIVAVLAIGLGSAAASAGAPSATTATVPYSAAQATSGATLFASKCAGCHGANLEGGAGPALTGATLNTLAKNTKLTVGDMFTFISQQMPLNEPASLTHDQYVAIMAFILHYNGYKPSGSPLTYQTAMSSKTVVRSLK
jgi:mono/diheme cytochrome c family protein